MAIKSINGIKKALMKELKAAMNEAEAKAKEDLKAGTDYFYAGGEPSVYQRTGALGDTPRTGNRRNSDTSITFEAYLDKSHTYTTGDCPSMEQVLNLANYGKAWAAQIGSTVGNKGFWEKAIKDVEQDFYSIIGKHFH